MHATDRQIISLIDVPVRLHLGVSAEERASPQIVRISVALTLYDPPQFTGHDRLDETIDYDSIIAFLRDDLPTREVRLIETVADLAAEHALSLSVRIACVEVSVEKPSVLGGAGAVRVGLLRHGDRLTHRHALFLAEEAARAHPRT